MMATTTLRRDEGVGLALAVAAHVALVAFLVWRPVGDPVVAPPERMTVTIADEMGPQSTSPEPMAQAAPDAGPEIGEPAPEPIGEPAPEPIAEPEPPQPIAKPKPPKPQPKPAPKPIARPAPPPPRPAPRVAPAPAPKPVQTARPRPAPRPATARPAAQPPRNAGASSFADAFKRGVPGAQAKGQSQNQAAAAPSTQLMSSWASSIGSRVIRPWNVCAPDGADAEKLRIMIRFTLDRTGGVASMDDPVVSGQTDANRPQVDRYKECAVRAIRSSAPFPGLPPEYYDHWKSRRLNFRKE